MKRGQLTLLVILALFAGFIGGIVSSHFLGDRTVFAREEPPAKEVLVAHEFLNGANVHAIHYEAAGEGMAQVMPTEVDDLCFA